MRENLPKFRLLREKRDDQRAIATPFEAPMAPPSTRSIERSWVEESLAQVLEGSPLSEVAADLGEHLRIGCDYVSMILFLSRVAGRMGNPINLVIFSESAGADRMIADRIAGILPKGVHRVDRIQQFRSLMKAGAPDVETIILRSSYDVLLHYGCEATCLDVTGDKRAPSVWLVTDSRCPRPLVGPTLGIMASAAARMLKGFGHHFSGPGARNQSPCDGRLRSLLEGLQTAEPLSCEFQEAISADLSPEEMVVFNRVLRVVAKIRIEHLRSRGESAQAEILQDDFRLARNLLTHLAIAPAHSGLSPYAVQTAELLYQQVVQNPAYQLTVPDHSDWGRKVFTRLDGERFTGLTYNAVKAHLSELEATGIIEGSLSTSKRQRGKQIYFHFLPGRHPPFGVAAPYERLPRLDQIAADSTRLQ